MITSEGRSFSEVALSADYPLPHDEQERERLDMMFNMNVEIEGGFYPSELDAQVKKARDILDLGAGTGRWAVEMAKLFPKAQVTAIDIVAIDLGELAVPPNLSLRAFDAREGLPFSDDSFDFVNLCFVTNLVNLPSYLEIARILRPGGILHMQCHGQIGLLDNQTCIAAHEFDRLIAKQFVRKMTTASGPAAADLLRVCGKFEDVHDISVQVPIGPWRQEENFRRIGDIQMNNVNRVFDGAAAGLLARGAPSEEVKRRRSKLREYTTQQEDRPYWTYHYVYAIAN